MNKKVTITTVLLVAAGAYAALYAYQRYLRNKANESVVSYDEAIKILDEK